MTRIETPLTSCIIRSWQAADEASLVRNATGPHTHDPRSGEIIN